MKLIQFASSLVILITNAQAVTIIDNFESNSLSGGSGWSNNWTVTGGGFVGGNEIDGSHAGALFGTSNMTRNFTPITTGTVSASWSVKGIGGLSDFNEIGVNIFGLKSNAQNTVITLKFNDANLSTLRLNDGGSDFSSGSVGYSDGGIYDFTFSSLIGSSNYSWSVTQRSGGTASGTDFTYSGVGTTLTNVSGIGFFWSAESGSGNDGFIDSVSVVPEPSASLLGGVGALLLLRRRRF